jgi:hypothetical protein
MARALWVYPGINDPTQRMAPCVRCGTLYTDLPGTTAACTFARLGPWPGSVCGTPVTIAADPAPLTTAVGVGIRGLSS